MHRATRKLVSELKVCDELELLRPVERIGAMCAVAPGDVLGAFCGMLWQRCVVLLGRGGPRDDLTSI